jgi:hypothetical protein
MSAANCGLSVIYFQLIEPKLLQTNHRAATMVKLVWLMCLVVLCLQVTSSWKYDRREYRRRIKREPLASMTSLDKLTRGISLASNDIN